MKKRVVFCTLLSVALLAKRAPSEAQSAPTTQKDVLSVVHSIANDGRFRESAIGISVLDLESDQVLGAHQEHEPLNPASNAKLYTAAAALALLSPSYRYHTAIYGVRRGESVAGPLVIRGHGDPSLKTGDLIAMASELAQSGIRNVDGDILVDQSFFDDVYTPPAFEQQPTEWAYFRAPVSAVAVNGNTLIASVHPTKKGSAASVTFDPPGFVDAEGTVATSGDSEPAVKLSLAPNGRRLTAHLGGHIAEGSHTFPVIKRVEDPTLFAGYVLKSALERVGIKVAGDVKAGSSRGNLLVRHESAPLSALLHRVGKNSDNFYAEMIFKSLSGEVRGGTAKSATSAEAIQAWVEHVGASDRGLVIKNGSGLFDANRVTAASITALLRAAFEDKRIEPEFMAQLAVSGMDGTLEGRLKGPRTKGLVRAKTGTLNDVIALSGYVLRTKKKPVAFACIFNRVTGKQDGARAACNRLVEKIAKLGAQAE